MKGKHTLVLGASLNPVRYSHTAVLALLRKEHPVTAIGLRVGHIGSVEVKKGTPKLEGIHTVTLYINPRNQKKFYSYLMDLKPNRIIFNPGTENPELRRLAVEHGIEVVYDCTLYMLSFNTY